MILPVHAHVNVHTSGS